MIVSHYYYFETFQFLKNFCALINNYQTYFITVSDYFIIYHALAQQNHFDN